MLKREAEEVFETLKKRGLSCWLEQAITKHDHGWVVCVQQKHAPDGTLMSIKPKHLMTIEQATAFIADEIVKKVSP